MEDDPGAVVRTYWERVWNGGDLAAVDELLTERYVRHSAAGNVVRSREQFRVDMTHYLQALTKADTTIEDQTVSGNTVWTRLTLRGVSVETEERVVLAWLHIARVEDGRIAEAWNLNAPVDWSTPPRIG